MPTAAVLSVARPLYEGQRMTQQQFDELMDKLDRAQEPDASKELMEAALQDAQLELIRAWENCRW